MERVIYTPPGGPPQGPPPDSAIYRIMGEGNIFRMMRDFYRELESSELRPLFPPDMEQASMKSAAFFVTILGGPPLYAQKYGPPRMRARHLPFEIDERARRVWLECFDRVLEGADGIRVDRDGRLYVATNMGIQICDQAGRVQGIIPTPNGKLSNFTFGGEHFDTLFATCSDRVYKRKLKVIGAQAWGEPNKPAPPRL